MADGASIKFPMEIQQGTLLCWAAVSVSVDKFFAPPHSGLEQGSLAEAVFKLSPGTCVLHSTHGMPPACDREADLAEGLNTVGRPVFTPVKPGPTVFGDVVKSLGAGRPTVIGITFLDKDSGHAVVIDGCRVNKGVQLVSIRDPRDGNDHEVRLADFVSAAGVLINTRVGQWTDVYHFMRGG
jgi:hypothetical protein